MFFFGGESVYTLVIAFLGPLSVCVYTLDTTLNVVLLARCISLMLFVKYTVMYNIKAKYICIAPEIYPGTFTTREIQILASAFTMFVRVTY